MVKALFQALLLACLSVQSILAASEYACTRTKVAVLGAGVAGVTAAVEETSSPLQNPC